MDEARFRAYLKRGGRSPGAHKRVIAYVRAYERFLEEQRAARGSTQRAAKTWSPL